HLFAVDRLFPNPAGSRSLTDDQIRERVRQAAINALANLERRDSWIPQSDQNNEVIQILRRFAANPEFVISRDPSVSTSFTTSTNLLTISAFDVESLSETSLGKVQLETELVHETTHRTSKQLQ